jgi:hypothetical protein
LDSRMGHVDALGGKIVLSRNVTYDDLRDLIIADYTNNGRKSLGDLKTTRLPRLDGVFEGTKAIDITGTSVEWYKTLRLKDKLAPATVNRELASLKRMFRLGLARRISVRSVRYSEAGLKRWMVARSGPGR